MYSKIITPIYFVSDDLQVAKLLLNVETKYLLSLIFSLSFLQLFKHRTTLKLSPDELVCRVKYHLYLWVFFLVWKQHLYPLMNQQTVVILNPLAVELMYVTVDFGTHSGHTPLFLSHLFSYVTTTASIHWCFTSADTPTPGTRPDSDHPGLLPQTKKKFSWQFFFVFVWTCQECSSCICLLLRSHGLFCCTESNKVNYEMIYLHGNLLNEPESLHVSSTFTLWDQPFYFIFLLIYHCWSHLKELHLAVAAPKWCLAGKYKLGFGLKKLKYHHEISGTHGLWSCNKCD